MDGELGKLRAQYEQSQKQELLQNAGNRSISMQSNKIGASSESVGGQVQLNRKNIKHKLLLNENPYSQKKDSDGGAKIQATNEQTSTKQSLNDSFLTNNQFKINRNYSSLNSARDTANQGQTEKLNLLMQQNEDL